MKQQNLRYIARVGDRGWCVRLPQRVGGLTQFFNAAGSMEAALEDAVTWRDSFFKEEPIARRFVEGAGVYTSRDKHTEYYNAVWQYEKKQVRRSFSTKVYGYLAEEVAHMARELGVLTELDRLEDHFERV